LDDYTHIVDLEFLLRQLDTEHTHLQIKSNQMLVTIS